MALTHPSGLSEPEPPKDGDGRVTPIASGEAGRVTPMMEQYVEIKAANPDCLLFYRMGDFYELFFEDAEVASRALGIMLTKRGKHLGADIPMCGVPVERADEYLHRLIALGHRVAVCEQLEDPAEAKKRGPKSVVRRDVVRLVTPGTLTEDTLLDAKRNNYLLSVARARLSSAGEDARFALAWIDISTAEFRITECDRLSLAAEIARLEPSEIIVSDALYSEGELAAFWRSLPDVTPLTRDVFDAATAERRLTSFFAVATSEAFGALTRLELTAAAACVTYVERTQIGKRPPLSPPLRESAGATMAIDQATRGNLELMRTLSGERRGSLLDAIDRSVTAAGSRLLAQRLSAPLTDPAAIAQRLDAVGAFVEDGGLRAETRSRLAAAPDLARALARIAVGRAGPRDLAAIRDGILAAAELARALGALKEPPAEIADAMKSCRRPDGMLAAELSAALAAELPAFKRDGGFVREGYDTALDETRRLRDESRRVIAALQARYAEQTGVRVLKIRHNNVLGYFVEVTAQHGDKLMAAPLNASFIHRQTLAGQVRFTTTELGDLESKIASAAERALGLELEIFERLAGSVIAESEAIKDCAEALARLDVATALAHLAVERDYARPRVDDSLDFVIEGGRHAVVEQALSKDGTPFVANDCDLSPPPEAKAGRIWLITGPNMAGKSTFLRQNALIAILAQMGSFVPAKSRAHRRGRPAVLARRRGRRSGARALDLHGRDGGDRRHPQSGRRALAGYSGRNRPRHRDLRRAVDCLGDRRASARRQHMPRAVRHAFPRADRAFRAPCAAAQRDGAGEGMAGRGGVPARSHRRRSRPLLRHPGRQACRPADKRDRARQTGARQARARGPRRAEGLRGPAAVRRALKPSAEMQEAAHDLLAAAIAALNPDDLSPREAMEALYRLKEQLAKTHKES